MGSSRARILIAESKPAHAEAIRRSIEAADCDAEIRVVGTLQEYRDRVAALPPDIALVDLDLPDGRAVEVLRSPPDAGRFPVLILTSHGSEQTAVDALRAGAFDYVVKTPASLSAMHRIVARVMGEWDLLQQRRRAQDAFKESDGCYRSLFENMREGLAHCRMIYEGGQPQDFVYLKTNTAFETLTGLRNVMGKRVTEVIPGIVDSNRELIDIYGKVAGTGRPERFETYVHPLGIWFSVSAYSTEKGHCRV